MWSRATHEVIYRSADRFMAVTQQVTSGEWSRAKPRVLFEHAFESGNIDVANYDVTPDGHFIVIDASGRDDSFKALRVVLNWAGSVAVTPR